MSRSESSIRGTGLTLEEVLAAERNFSVEGEPSIWAGLVARLEKRNARRRKIRRLARAGSGVGLAFAFALFLLLFLPHSNRVDPIRSVTSGAEPAVASAFGAGKNDWNILQEPGLGRIESEQLDRITLSRSATTRVVELREGEYRASLEHQEYGHFIVFETPHLRVTALGTQLDLRVTAAWTLVTLLEGSVQVDFLETGASVILSPGEAIRSDARPLHESLPAVGEPASMHLIARAELPKKMPVERPHPRVARTAPSISSPVSSTASPPPPVASPEIPPQGAETVALCKQKKAPSERTECLIRLSAGRGLGAQGALLQLGNDARTRPSEAIGYFDALERRFPGSGVAREGAFAKISVLDAQGRKEEALKSAEHFVALYPNDWRLPEVNLIRAKSLCRIHGREQVGVRILEGLELMENRVGNEARRMRDGCGFGGMP